MAGALDFFNQNPKVETLDAFVVDLNGCLRGKKIPRSGMEKVLKEGLRLPRSVFAVDIWGADVLPAGLVTETGDHDGICLIEESSLSLVPWQDGKAAQAILSMWEPKSDLPFFADPRQALKKVLARYDEAALTPVVAIELEFYLLDTQPDADGNPQPPRQPRTGKRSQDAQILSIGEVEAFAHILQDISSYCEVQGLPVDTTTSENGPGQYEINLKHVSSALQAADHAVLLKRAVKAAARKHGLDATFMAKPYGAESGSGMHMHLSILDASGQNIFAGADAKGAPALQHAIGGMLAAMVDSTAFFAPNYNSYRRFRPGSHAPTRLAWAYDNRGAALRVPQSDLAATRIEHRVAGADANPYLALAAVLAAALQGMHGKMDPGAAAEGDIYQTNAKSLPTTWEAALEAFAQSGFVAHYFGADFQKVYLACKQQEKELLAQQVTRVEHDAYLRDI